MFQWGGYHVKITKTFAYKAEVFYYLFEKGEKQ